MGDLILMLVMSLMLLMLVILDVTNVGDVIDVLDVINVPDVLVTGAVDMVPPDLNCLHRLPPGCSSSSA